MFGDERNVMLVPYPINRIMSLRITTLLRMFLLAVLAGCLPSQAQVQILPPTVS